MKMFTGWQYLLIDLANHYGLDKLLFEQRIEWATTNLPNLEALADQAETKPLYLKAVMAIRKAQQGIPTGHMVGLDACCSGIQIMSALTGCAAGAMSTGMVDPNARMDAYTRATEVMTTLLGSNVDVSRKQAKDAIMTSFYGSKKVPKDIFGEKTPEIDAFYQAAHTIAPGAWELLQDLLASWQPFALSHSWKLPDGFDARVKVMKKQEARIEVDELDHATFTYEFYENIGEKKGLSNVANMTHSMDGWVLRSMHRRCNYDREVMENAASLIELELMERTMGAVQGVGTSDPRVAYYVAQYEHSTLADVVIVPHLEVENIAMLSTEHLQKLMGIIDGMLVYQPFELVTVHDEFRAHANNCNHVRWVYREIMAEIAESDVLSDLLTQITGTPGTFNKLSFNLPAQIRASNYSLC